MSPSTGLGGGASDEDVEADKSRRDSDQRSLEDEAQEELDQVLPSVEQERLNSDDEFDLADYGGERLDAVLRTPSPTVSIGNTDSLPDDTPSLRGSRTSSSLPGTPSPRGSISRTPSSAIKPFERRFQSRFSVSPSPSRITSPAFLSAHSRQSSVASQFIVQNGEPQDPAQTPWEVVRWTKLRKISGQAFSEIGKRQLGTPTCLAVSASIVVGTSKGLILVFDYHQNLKSIIGQGTKAMEAGSITSLAISADYSTVAGGHSSGAIFTWEIAHPAKPFLAIPALTAKDREANADGHVVDRNVLHLGFLGTRHTALVSADDGGMAFSHLATRGFGAVGRAVKTTRLLGRYPSQNPEDDRNRKASTVLAFAPLPLGNVEQATDGMGLTALLTPYLLVIVSTTPIAQTQYKCARPKEITPHGAMSGCLAWFPAVKLKVPVDGKDVSDNKLVYCWSDLLTVLDVEIGPIDPKDKDKQPGLFFRPRSRWNCEEAIVAVQWLSRSIIGVLTISQRLIILEDVGDLHVTDSVDLLQRHILHRDFFSTQLRSVVEQNEQEADIHGVVADAFYMSLKAYKGRLFLMGFGDLSVGTLSNWADRLSALVEHGDDIGAIQLGVAYYHGQTGKVSVGLPEDEDSRHDMVRARVLELLGASLRYRLTDVSAEDDRLHELTIETFEACLAMEEMDFLLDDAYELYKDGNENEIFIDTLESHIMDGEIRALPPTLVKDVVEYYASTSRELRLEEMLCHLDAHTFDLDQVTRLCKTHHLYDALIYVWNQALSDWVTPFSELIALARDRDATDADAYDAQDRLEGAEKVFPYLAFSLTGRLYPNGDFMDEETADNVRQDLYKVLFSPHEVSWPPGSDRRIRASPVGEAVAFPYLDLLLHFDASSAMSMLNEAFEDAFLNSNQDLDSDVPAITNGNGSRSKMTRQQIVSILLEVMSNPDYDPTQTIFLDIFIARSLPKYSQFLILSGSALQHILDRLCQCEVDDLADECQLSVEYLLSVYHPPITPELVSQLYDAGFFRVLKSVYRAEHRWNDLIALDFEDANDRQTIFVDVADAFEATKTSKQKAQVADLVCAHATQLAFEDLKKTSDLACKYLAERLDEILDSLSQSSLQYAFLQEILEPGLHQRNSGDEPAAPEELVSRFSDRYVQLMCSQDPMHVSDYVSKLDSSNLHLDSTLPEIEKHGVVDAAVLLLAKEGLARDAMERLVTHVKSLESAMSSILVSAPESPDPHASETAIKDLQQDLEKYIQLGIWLCRGQSKIADASPSSSKLSRKRNQNVSENDLTLDEYLWLSLVDATVEVSKNIIAAKETVIADGNSPTQDPTAPIRRLVQQVFTALLTSTAAPPTTTKPAPAPQPPSSFLPIFRAFLTRAAALSGPPSLSSDLGAVLHDMFSAYAHEADVLALAADLLRRDAFAGTAAAHARRQQGWRARVQVCEGCKLRAFGPGVGREAWDAWRDAEGERSRKSGGGGDKGKGKGRGGEEVGPDAVRARQALELVVFACRHCFHRACLEGGGGGEGYVCPVCEERRAGGGAG